MKLSSATILTLAATAIAAPVATVTVHDHVKQTVVVEGYVYFDGTHTTTGYTTHGAAPAATQTDSPAPASTASPAASPLAESAVEDDSSSPAPSPSTNTAPASTQPASVVNNAAELNIEPATTSSSEQPSTTSTPAPSPTPTTTTSSSSSSAAPAATSSASSSDSNLSSFASEMVNAHNSKRSLHKNTPPVSWSDDLASYAQNYADNYDCSGTLTHSGGPYGENLALGYGNTGSVEAWYDEIKDYDYSNPGFSMSTGHFTQVVWKASTSIGCGVKQCDSWGAYIICSYDPAGNVEGGYQDNVQPLA
ncbi:Protein PRY1 [Kluyveromyces marxianus]